LAKKYEYLLLTKPASAGFFTSELRGYSPGSEKTKPRLLQAVRGFLLRQGERHLNVKNSIKSSLRTGGRMTPKAANFAGITLALSVFVVAASIATAVLLYAFH
jgi:hypothetical protein